MIAYCGLNCSKCDAYLATEKNDERKREAALCVKLENLQF